MRPHLARLALGMLVAAAPAFAQNAEPGRTRGPGSTSEQISQTGKRTTRAGKPVLPDPDLLDGSVYEPEKRPLFVMQSEIEMGEQEAKQGDKVSPESGPGGSQGDQQEQGGSGQEPKEKRAQPGGNEAKAEGIKVENLKIPEGNTASQQDIPTPPKPRDLQIGDATLQIQTIPMTAQKDIVGTQSSNAQASSKNIPQGQQTDNRNKGSEKGKVVPKGL